ncbi:MAG: molybdopterin converting factor subunit 1 [Sulfuricellaceae bacterium]|nr:molybdopterin converting factor subunit 1 [Sulfuricellaceae bacterium]
MITVLYFARLRESLGLDREQIELSSSLSTVGDLIAHLRARGGAWQTELAPGKPVRIAVDQDMANPATPLADGCEVALFPPVTGG